MNNAGDIVCGQSLKALYWFSAVCVISDQWSKCKNSSLELEVCIFIPAHFQSPAFFLLRFLKNAARLSFYSFSNLSAYHPLVSGIHLRYAAQT